MSHGMYGMSKWSRNRDKLLKWRYAKGFWYFVKIFTQLNVPLRELCSGLPRLRRVAGVAYVLQLPVSIVEAHGDLIWYGLGLLLVPFKSQSSGGSAGHLFPVRQGVEIRSFTLAIGLSVGFLRTSKPHVT